MSGKYFIDTNLFVYSFDEEHEEKRQIALDLISDALNHSKGIISFQVIQEFINVAINKFKIPLSINDCRKYLTVVLEPLCEIFSGVELYHQALEITERWQYSFYDALIISSALKAECSILYTEDLQHGQTIRDLFIQNPFLS
jgi:predicted nucleic acid-binding protein